MPSNLLAGPHLWILLIVILLLFGAAKLPALAKSMGQSARIFKGEMKAMKDDDSPAATTESTAAPADTTGVQQATAAPADPAKPGATDAS
ncbi:MAG: preprotein translocase subunit TatA [Microbacterium sp. SCN 70-200]|uniref:Sec-independent protein translocase subunit TatA n=1 Tax=unclassified Microbacterium TaxID=2609290 RepID=UPI000869D82D|nr:MULTISPECIES: Sec-independent protein translocase subunit TatA [unclassified Microbacterium]MBN9214332.1 Sec-independent protein translocase subunit TatA [Microbacterium sp.]ODT40973.1 MAG: preprotein translocase subunit TatA [Microbacterium sp. SCN 70-200]OJV83856.1 MAG: Sec-independent protein translocase TatA [Microbacterium sp. 70-16]